MGLRDFIAKRREETKIGNAERARDKDEERAAGYSARREGKLEGIKKGARERGFKEGERKGLGQNRAKGFIMGVLAPKTHTVTTRRTTGKGRNRHTVTTTREVRGKGGAGGLGFNIGGPSADSFSLGGHPSEGIGIGFGSEGHSRKKKKSDDSWMNDVSL